VRRRGWTFLGRFVPPPQGIVDQVQDRSWSTSANSTYPAPKAMSRREGPPTRRARPRGVEAFVAVSPTGTPPPPSDVNAFRSVLRVTKGSTMLSYESPKGRKKAHEIARSVTRRNA
jgi:hypothetical protein